MRAEIHSSSSPCLCEIHLQGFPLQMASVPLISSPEATLDTPSIATSFYLKESSVKALLTPGCFKAPHAYLEITVFTGRQGSYCGVSSRKQLIGTFRLQVGPEWGEGKSLLLHNGWISIGKNRQEGGKLGPELHLRVKLDPDPRYVFRFEDETSLSPQIVQLQGTIKQPIFSCKFSRDRSHMAAIAAGNNGIPVKMHGYEFGKASGMAPRARIAVYKALYRLFGGFVTDVVAAIEQAVQDGVDILNLSVGANSPPTTTRTSFLNPFDAALLSAVKAGVFVAQAAGNGGPFPKTLVSYSPWIATVAAAVDDRRYKNHITLGNGKILPGIGLAPSTHSNRTFNLVAASDIMLDSSDVKYSPYDCQTPEVLNKNKVEGNILLCGYSFNFIVGSASMKRVSETAKSLGAVGFVLAVENASPGTKFDPVPVGIPGILITDVSKSLELINYYNSSTTRDWAGRVTGFKATGSIGDGLTPVLHRSAPQVALFSSRGPDIKDFSYQDADILKPDILAPGSLIWAAWAPNGTDEANYIGEGFAMISGTSMAAPHIAGIAALIKQKHPNWSPAAIKSALMTTASTLDRAGQPLQAQQYSGTETMTFVKGTPFDYGSGAVNPRAALDPGLIFDAGYEDYISFLCSTPGIDHREISNLTNSACDSSSSHPANLNSPSIAVSRLVGTQTITRTVTNVAETETYVITTRMSPEIALEVNPPAMTLRSGASQIFSAILTARSVTGTYSFGEILMKGSRGHKVRIPVVAMGYSS